MPGHNKYSKCIGFDYYCLNFRYHNVWPQKGTPDSHTVIPSSSALPDTLGQESLAAQGKNI